VSAAGKATPFRGSIIPSAGLPADVASFTAQVAAIKGGSTQ
jgi:hypothetical protein